MLALNAAVGTPTTGYLVHLCHVLCWSMPAYESQVSGTPCICTWAAYISLCMHILSCTVRMLAPSCAEAAFSCQRLQYVSNLSIMYVVPRLQK